MKNTNATKEQAVNAAMQTVEELSTRCEDFQKATESQYHQELYKILADIYALYKNTIDDGCLKEVVANMRNSLASKNPNLKIQKNTRMLTFFVRYFFNCSKGRAYNYNKVLLAAISQDIQPENFVQFIHDGNGIEEIKREITKTDKTKQAEEALQSAIENVTQTLKTLKAKNTVKFDSPKVEFAENTSYVFIIAKASNDGEYELLQTVPKTTKGLESIAIKEIAKFNIQQKNNQEQMIAASAQKTKKNISALDAANMDLGDLDNAA